MTNELEKTFFDTFGIEPKLNSPCEQLLQNKYCNENSGSRDTFFDPFPYCVGFENCAKDYKARVWVYPKITDRILLELICMANQHEDYPISTNIKNIQARTLRILLRTEKFYKNYYGSDGRYKKLVKQVRTLFEEG